MAALKLWSVAVLTLSGVVTLTLLPATALTSYRCCRCFYRVLNSLPIQVCAMWRKAMRVAGINSPILSPTGTMSSTGASVFDRKRCRKAGSTLPCSTWSSMLQSAQQTWCAADAGIARWSPKMKLPAASSAFHAKYVCALTLIGLCQLASLLMW